MEEIRILNRTLTVEEIKEENNTQYRIWYRSFTNMLVNETIPKDNAVVNYSDHKAVVETLEKDIENSGNAVEDLIDLVDEIKAEKLTMQNKIDELEKLKESMLKRSCNNCGLFGEGCEVHCKEAGLCFCHDWIAKGIK